ncbi:hypothetical protein [Parasitella parasitica]|uniref:Uncharacterized protein n=1 Tax=Parasitella parasitica TaxID=35722 RepID=A0A0B7NWN9_9FUNG|nr:hypothetical protein [Parasitella parasitica]
MESKCINSVIPFFVSLCDFVEEVGEYISRQNTPKPGTSPPAGNQVYAEAAADMSSQDHQAAVMDTSDQAQRSSSSDIAQWFDELYNNSNDKDDQEGDLNDYPDAENHLADANEDSQTPSSSSSAAATSSANVNENHDNQAPSNTNKKKHALNNASKIADNTKTLAENSKAASDAFVGSVNTKKRLAASIEEADISAIPESPTRNHPSAIHTKSPYLPNPWSQSLSRSYGSISPTFLTYIVLSTRGFSPCNCRHLECTGSRN